MTAQPKEITILGATGSVGASCLDIIAHAPDTYRVTALSANENWEKLSVLARRLQPEFVAIGNTAHVAPLRAALTDLDICVEGGVQGICEAARRGKDIVIGAIVGAAGLAPTFAAIDHTRRIALANKEVLVCAGQLFMRQAAAQGVEVIPVDSEHNALFQLLRNEPHGAIEKLTLTASGGPFRDWPRNRIAAAGAACALKHPNWSMGKKISIDSATLMNKGLEAIEAHYLFAVAPEQIAIVVHAQSIVHGLVNFIDGSVLAALAAPDMRLPLAYALSWPQRQAAPVKRLDLNEIGSLTFAAPDTERFPCLALALDAMGAGQGACIALNAANEGAVAAYLAGAIGFYDIAAIIEAVVDKATSNGPEPMSLAQVIDFHQEARRMAQAMISS